MKSVMNSAIKRPSHSKGFTLIELLVAISILAIVAVLGWRGLDGIVRARKALTVQLEQTRGLQLAFAQMQSDCEHLAGDDLLRKRIRLAAAPNRLSLVRTSAGESQAMQLQVVTYRLQDGVLTRRESGGTRDLAQLDALWQAAQGDNSLGDAGGDNDNGGTPVVLQRGLDSMTMRAWDGFAWQVQDGSVPFSAKVTGFEVMLQLPGQAAGLVKVFLLGPV
jgi:general secretion pathway protein J